MATAPSTIDWNQVRSLLAVSETGSLSAAARALGLTQPTLGRQIAAMEKSLGVVLFERGKRGLALTETGRQVLAQARVMGHAADRVALIASSHSGTLDGLVLVTASDVLSVYHLPPMLKKLQQQAPGIQVQVVASNAVRDLYKREADIAIRHVRPREQNLIARLIRESSASLFASDAYIAEHGLPHSLEELNKARFIGFDSMERSTTVLNSMGLLLSEKNFRVLTDNGLVGIEMLRLGLGIALMAEETALLLPELKRINVALKPISYPVWLIAHSELHTSSKLRFVYDFLAAELQGEAYSSRSQE